MVLSIAQAQDEIEKLKKHEISLGRAPATWYTYHNHVYGVAKAAQTVASQIPSMNTDRLYVMALLHDICRTEDERLGRFHGILGYEKLIQKDPDAARSSLLHTFLWNKLPPYSEMEKLFYHKKSDYDFVADFIRKNPPIEEDYLIQLCDYLANKDGFVTIEQRIAELIERRGNKPFFEAKTLIINELKRYFDQKIGCNIYDLLHT